MDALSRRTMLLAPVALTGSVLAAAPKKMTLAMHQNTSAGGLPQVAGRLVSRRDQIRGNHQ